MGQVDDPQTAEQLYQRNSPTVKKKVLGPTTDFPTWGSSKETENPQGIWLWRPVGFDYRTFRALGKHILRGHKQNLVCIRSQEKGAVSSQESKPDLPMSVQESLAEAWLTAACCWVRGTEYNSSSQSPLEGGHHYHHYPYHSLTSG